MIERLTNRYGVNQPIFTSEILDEMKEYSCSYIFQLLKKEEKKENIVKFIQGVYYIPTETRYGKSLISVEQVIKKKYIEDNEVFGVYGGLITQQNFMMTYQIPTAIEVITNNESMSVRKIKIKNRDVILRKSRLPITKENKDVYTILELFTNIDIKKYLSDPLIQREIKNFIKEKGIKSSDVYALVSAFPSKTTKNIIESGIINDFL